MKRALAFSLIVLGITSLIGQVHLIRELMIVFYGNEFFIGWILFAWFLWIALGSFWAGRLDRKLTSPAQGLIGCHVAATLLLPMEILLARGSRLVVGTMPGEIPDLFPSLVYSFIALAPLCLLLGAQFVMAARAWESLAIRPKLNHILGESYVYETLGFVIGGILFGYFFVTVNEFQVASLVAWLNVFVGSALAISLRPQRLFAIRLLLILVSTLTAIVFLLAGPIQQSTAQLRFPGQELIATRNSIYGNLAITRNGTQNNFFENGLFLASDHDEMANEYAIHFPLLSHPAPKNVLLIGNGFNGALTEILKHHPDRVDYVELDPLLIRLAREHVPADLNRAFDDPRVHVTTADGRFFIKQRLARNEAGYDVVIVNLPNPSTALINRYFTKDFFQEARGLLKPGGLLSTRLAFSPDYVSRELTTLSASVYQSLQCVFNHVTLLPEYEIFYLASAQKLAHSPATLVERLRQRQVETQFVTPAYIEYRLTTDRISQVRRALDSQTSADINRDDQPVACFYNLVYWLSSFHPPLAKLVADMEHLSWSWIAGVIALLCLLVLGARRSAIGVPILAMAAGSFSLMACEVTILLAFQIFYGYLYYRLSLIIAGLMLGMAVGTWTATNVIDRAHSHTLSQIHGALAAYSLLFLWISHLLAGTPAKYSSTMEMIFLLLAAAIGALVGFEYPVANKLYLEQRDHQAGTIYGVDLMGSCLGALLAGVWMLPVLGITGTMIVLIVLNAMVTVAAAASTPLRILAP